MNSVEIMQWFEKRASQRIIDDMINRYGITTRWPVFGVPVGTMQSLAKKLKKDLDAAQRHALADELWNARCYENRMLATMIDEPALLTVAQLDQWTADFDNWGICDTACFHLFDKSPLAWDRIPVWAASPEEFVKRTAFALMACLALHDKQASDDHFLKLLPLIEKHATDDRNFVKKSLSWALRAMGTRGGQVKAAALELAERLSGSPDATARWLGREALRALAKPSKRTANKNAPAKTTAKSNRKSASKPASKSATSKSTASKSLSSKRAAKKQARKVQARKPSKPKSSRTKPAAARPKRPV